MGIDNISWEIKANKEEAYDNPYDAFAKLMKLREAGISASLIQRFDDVWYVVENNWKSDTTRENYFKKEQKVTIWC